MRLLIVSGRSGSGKTVTLNVLEDLGFYCVDNLPVSLLAELCQTLQSTHPELAVSIDARNLPQDSKHLKQTIAKLKHPGHQCEILYLDATDDQLLKRFSETRRKHPLTKENTSLKEAIHLEKALLSPISNLADITIDTSKLNNHQLSMYIRERLVKRDGHSLSLLLQSFGYKNGALSDADYMFDVRCLPNPYWESGLRAFTGLDKEVHHFLEKSHETTKMLQDIQKFLSNWVPHFEKNNRSYITIGIGCTGGQHRSVYVASKLGQLIKPLQYPIQIRHRDLQQ